MEKNNIIAMLGHKRIPSREGGVEIVVEELATRMAKLGYDVVVYNRKGKHALDKSQHMQKVKEYKGVRIKETITIDKKGLAAMTSSLFATISILFSKAKIVHYHAEGPCAMIPIIKFFSKKRIIATIHGLDWKCPKWGKFSSSYIKFGEKMAAKYADEIIVLSENAQQYFMQNYNRKTRFIPNGVSMPKIVEPSIIEEKFGLKKDSYLLFLGRIVPGKGIEYLIDAFNKLKTDKKLVIAGGASDTDLFFDELKEKTRDNSNIIFTGFVQGQELDELYSNSYIYVLPSDSEGMPLSLLEAMSYNNCCVTSDIKECSTVIENKGVTFKKSDVDDLTLKLQKLCDNTDIVRKYKKESQKFILGKYNWDFIVDETLKIYGGDIDV